MVSNPPYVAADELDGLEPELRYEPREALVGEGDHEAVARAALDALRPGGALVFEVADTQAPSIRDLLRRLGYQDVVITDDLAGRERVVDGRRP